RLTLAPPPENPWSGEARPPLGAHGPVQLPGHSGELGWRDPARLHPRKVFVGRPTGDCAALSDVDRNLVVEELLEKIARGGDPNALNAFGRLLHNQFRCVAGQDNSTLLIRLHGA